MSKPDKYMDADSIIEDISAVLPSRSPSFRARFRFCRIIV
ncbi:hypothetical protein GACE_2267 [Geoglobus acetivorans]|uniref:Uncharacterized protein n=1 Tax=Geoglobus acetivorans TaxID=565033 RepID=A0A0A7GEN3_GEOAI|nr:hypothetical protein GACE_2267 [Geoglobus acetivorans]